MASPQPWKVVILCLLLVISVSPLFLYLSLSHYLDTAAAASVNVDQTDRNPKLQLGFRQGFSAVSWEADVGEYFVDVFIGTPAVRFSMILDTGSDLTWVKCSSRHSNFNPNRSSSFRRIRRDDQRCDESSSRDDERFCRYNYTYEDKELFTSGDLATETFTLSVTSSASNSDIIGLSETITVDNVIFGCSNSNQLISSGGYNPFVVASGVLGLGGGPLSFTTQLQPLYGHSFSYCLTRTNTNKSTSPTKLVFGQSDGLDPRSLNFTSFVRKNPNLDITYYYVQIRSIVVGGEVLEIPGEIWEISQDGSHGGTIIDSGSTVSVFPHRAHQIIKEAFLRKVTKYQLIFVEEHELSPCYNVSGLGVEKLAMPEFGIVFGDGAVWNFPVENYFMEFEDNVVCLAIQGVKNPRFSIIGNLQQQNFHMVINRKEGRLGFAPSRCADI